MHILWSIRNPREEPSLSLCMLEKTLMRLGERCTVVSFTFALRDCKYAAYLLCLVSCIHAGSMHVCSSTGLLLAHSREDTEINEKLRNTFLYVEQMSIQTGSREVVCGASMLCCVPSSLPFSVGVCVCVCVSNRGVWWGLLTDEVVIGRGSQDVSKPLTCPLALSTPLSPHIDHPATHHWSGKPGTSAPLRHTLRFSSLSFAVCVRVCMRKRDGWCVCVCGRGL